jgi:hypothetical protein
MQREHKLRLVSAQEIAPPMQPPSMPGWFRCVRLFLRRSSTRATRRNARSLRVGIGTKLSLYSFGGPKACFRLRFAKWSPDSPP